MRITSQMMLKQYKNDVTDAYASMTKAMRHAYDYRAFDLPSDDPLAASQTFGIHYEMNQNADYASNISSVNGEFTSAEKILQNVDSILSTANNTTTLKAISGTMNKDNRSSLADELVNFRDQIVSQLNTKYADSYLFSGSGSGSQPFELVKSSDPDHPENDKLYYRGVNVDTGLTKDQEAQAATDTNILNGSDASAKPAAQADLNKLNSDGADTLKQLSDDKVFVDIGLGLEVDGNGKVNEQSAFNKSIPAIAYLGSGKDDDGTPKNLCSLLSKISGALKASKNEDLLSQNELDTISKYTTAFNASQNVFVGGQQHIGHQMQFLSSTKSYISSQDLNLASRDNDVEYLSPYEAIENFYSQMYCYNASLKAGSQILQQSLMDYLK